ncbi:hypothetical protein JTB14_001029 [Gonioctena quinquepunctata]|nr:hypothetical protein JTB14_001029 [Gonioctena quinquepunctata]
MPIHRGSTSIITDISGNVLSKEGSVKVTFQLPSESIEHDCIVCDDGLSFPSDGLLGVDFLNKFRPTLDFQKNLLILQRYSLVMSDDHLILSHRTIDTNSPVVRKVPIDVETRQLFSVGKQMCDNVEWYSGFTEVNIKNNFGKSDVSKLCIGTADSTPQENVGTIDHGIEENGPVESHTLASGLVCKPTGDMRIDLSLSNRSGDFNIASISDNSPKERTDNQTTELAAADDKGRRNAVPSASKDNNLKGSSLVRLQHQVYIPPFHGCDFDVPVDIRNSKGVKVCEPLNLPPGLCVAQSVVTIPHHNQNHSKPSIVVRILNISPIPQTINKHTPILTLADVTVLEGQDIPVTKNTIAQVEFNLQHMEVSEKEVFQQFLHTYEYIFAKTGKPLEATKLVKHRIDMETVRQYTYGGKRQDKRNTWQKIATGPCQQTEAMFGHRRPERPIRAEVQTVSGAGLQVARGNKKAGGWGINKSVSASTGEANRSGEKLTTGQPEFPPAEEPTSSGHPREATATTGPPKDFEGPITKTQETTGTPRTATTGAEAGARMEGTTLPNLERRANLGEEPTRTPDSTRRHTRSHGPVPEHTWIRQSRI